MRKDSSLIICLAVILMVLPGCAPVVELGRTVWGSSTRALQQARDHALTQDFDCDPASCLGEVLAMSTVSPQDPAAAPEPAPFSPFLVDRRRQRMVVMGVPGSVDTTEVGIFFYLRDGRTAVDVASLSSYARDRVAAAVFARLSAVYPSANP